MIEILLTKLGVAEYGYDWQTFILAVGRFVKEFSPIRSVVSTIKTTPVKTAA
jgi:hypothetical protein